MDARKGSQRHLRNGVAFFFMLTVTNVSEVPKAAKEYPVSANIDDAITENFASRLQPVSILSFLKGLARMDDELSILSPERP